MTEAFVIGGDVGGTNSRLALYKVPTSKVQLIEGKQAPGEVVFSKWYQNSSHETFTAIMSTFLSDAKAQEPQLAVKNVASACIAVAGPVSKNEVTMTNRGKWVISGSQLSREFNIPRVVLVNDFVALGYGLLTVDRSPDSKDVRILQDALPQPGAPIACIGAGTGLGECFLTPGEGGRYVAYPTEGGHAEFPPRTDLEFKLLRYLKNKFAQKHRVSVERVISGPGIANVYEFLASHFPDRVDPVMHKEFEESREHGGRVVAMHSKKPGSLAEEAMNIFISAYGAEAGVAGLKWMPFGGLFITGGLTPKNIDRIQGTNSLFMQAFRDKGRVSPFLETIPLYAVMSEDLGERGAHWVAVQLLLEHMGATSGSIFQSSAPEEKCSFIRSTKYPHAVLALAIAGVVASLSIIISKGSKK